MRAGKAKVELQVTDAGPGITPENRSAIFEEFRRLDLPSPWGKKGLGLGLSICERIAAILERTLTLRSKPGRGSTFGIRVPRAAGRAPGGAHRTGLRKSRSKPRRSGNTHAFMCVDDDAATLAGLRELLTSWKFHVVAASSARRGAGQSRTRSRSTSCSRISICRSGPRVSTCFSAWCCTLTRGEQARAGALLTADATELLLLQAAELGIPVLRKPVLSGGIARADFGAGGSRRACESALVFGRRWRELMQRQTLRDQYRLRAIFGAHLLEDGCHVR